MMMGKGEIGFQMMVLPKWLRWTLGEGDGDGSNWGRTVLCVWCNEVVVGMVGWMRWGRYWLIRWRWALWWR